MSEESEIVEMRGHLIDSMILANVMNRVVDRGGRYEFLEFDVGKSPADTSYARLRVTGRDSAHLAEILEDIHQEGVTEVSPGEATLREAPADATLPVDFYSTTNNETRIYLGGKWLTAQKQMMDKCIIVQGGTASCTPIRDVRKGDMVVCGEEGIRVVPPPRPRTATGLFEFMNSGSSSERPTQHIAKTVASDIYDTKKEGGRIIIVGGPAIVHTGGAPSVAALIRDGYIDGVLAGNALAVHDIENALYGTSLGMRVKDATLVSKGHRNHMDTVNAVFTHGSIPDMVEKGVLKRGIFYECVKRGVPFVLAGSIRDDGPLPDVITDVVDAQREYKKVLKGADMVIMISTMLHSIATGNMLPSTVRTIAVDINQSTVTKLLDRGTWQALGIVTDVGAFLPLVEREIAGMASARP
ncbi:MAG: TIGR00300 family protein [Thaumarchaeota archaeon]|nr:TIGR00300 family protein [Nitrososphaerota archaeon]